MFTPKAVHYPATSNPDEILVSGVDENNRAANAPIVTDSALAAQLRDTPAMIPNPAYQPLVEEIFAAAVAAVQAHEDRLNG